MPQGEGLDPRRPYEELLESLMEAAQSLLPLLDLVQPAEPIVIWDAVQALVTEAGLRTEPHARPTSRPQAPPLAPASVAELDRREAAARADLRRAVSAVLDAAAALRQLSDPRDADTRALWERLGQAITAVHDHGAAVEQLGHVRTTIQTAPAAAVPPPASPPPLAPFPRRGPAKATPAAASLWQSMVDPPDDAVPAVTESSLIVGQELEDLCSEVAVRAEVAGSPAEVDAAHRRAGQVAPRAD